MVPLTRASATRIQAAAKQTTDCHLTKPIVKFSFRRETKIPNRVLILVMELVTVRMKGVTVGVVMAIKIQLQTSSTTSSYSMII